MTVVIHHRLPGRTRLRLEKWPSAAAFGRIQHQLAHDGCRIARANPASRSLLVLHPEMTCAEDVRRHVETALGTASSPVDSGIAAQPQLYSRETIRTSELDEAAVTDAEQILSDLRSLPQGLSAKEAEQRLATHGPNATPTPLGRPRAEMAVAQFTTFPVAMLAGSAILSVATGGIVDAAVTLGVVFLNAAIGFSSENATENLIRRLSRPVDHATALLRGGDRIIVSASEVVPGDIITVAPGSFVPADARVLDAHHLSVDESSLTGESLPVHKVAEALETIPESVAERFNILHGGTVVTGGHGKAVAIATGARTEMARTRAMIGSARPPRPEIEEELSVLGRGLTVGCLGASALVFAIGLLRGEPVLSLAKSAIALAVAAIPEGLPAVATSTLALGAKEMEKNKAYARALPAIEALASVDTICLDKTGTLTENRMRVVAACVDRRTMDLSPGKEWNSEDIAELRPLAEAVSLCNEASLTKASGSATELALLHFAQLAGVEPETLKAGSPPITVHSRNHTRRWMATEHRHNGSGLLAVKGAADELLALATHELRGGTVVPLDDARRREILDANLALAAKGLRVLGVARREKNASPIAVDNLVWLGLVALADPIRAEAREAIATFHKAGIRTIILTGDQPATALSVAEELALSRTGIIPVLETSRFTGLSDREVGELALKTSVFARVSPSDKLRIVRGLQAVGKRPVMIGDGVNDGPALRAAAVGVAMGAGGTDVAREVADIVIADDDLRSLARAIAHGRATGDNIINAIRYFLSTNLAEVLLMVGESLHGRGELETPMELFWLNLVTDILPGLGLALAEPRGDVMTRPPRDTGAPIFDRDDIRSMALDGSGMATVALAAHFIGDMRAGPGPRARGMAFLTLALAQIAQTWTLRDRSPNAGEALTISERRLEAALGASTALLAAPFVLPPLRKLLGIGIPALGDLALSGALAGAYFTYAEGRRHTIRGTSARAETSPESPPARTASSPAPRLVHAQAG